MHTSACEMSLQLVAALSLHLASLAAELIALCKVHPDWQGHPRVTLLKGAGLRMSQSTSQALKPQERSLYALG